MTDHEPLRARDVREIHDRIVAVYDLDNPGVSRHNADRFLEDVTAQARGEDDPFDKAAIYLSRLIELHVFEDGNKRTAWLAALHTLHQHGEVAEPDRSEVPTVLKHVRRYQRSELREWLRTGEIDRSRLRR